MSKPEHRAAPARGPRALRTAGLALVVTATPIALGISLIPGPVTAPPVTLGTAHVVPLPTPQLEPSPSRPTTQAPRSFDRTQHPTTDPSSPWVVVNKRRGLDPAYSPALATVRGTQVSVAVAPALTRLLEAADELDLALDVASGYRSYTRQEQVYSRSVAQRGTDHADTVSARPGHSEHQTGLAVDITTAHAPDCTLHPCFGETAAGKWLAEEGWRYGFIVRYTGDNSDVTGFAHEPWHLRWVGRPLAREMRRTRTTSLEEFFGVAGGDYDNRAGAGGS